MPLNKNSTRKWSYDGIIFKHTFKNGNTNVSVNFNYKEIKKSYEAGLIRHILEANKKINASSKELEKIRKSSGINKQNKIANIEKEIKKQKMIKGWLEHIIDENMFNRIPIIKNNKGYPMGNGYTAIKKFKNVYMEKAHNLWVQHQDSKLDENQYFHNSINAFPGVENIAWVPTSHNKTHNLSSAPPRIYNLSKVGLIFGYRHNIPDASGES